MAENTKVDNTKRAHSYLKSFRGEGHINVVAIHPQTGKVTGITRPVQDKDVYDFIKKNDGAQNLYYMVNEPSPSAPDNKLKKHHVDKIHAVWIDADPQKNKPFDEERKRLKQFTTDLSNGNNPPTYIIDSGSGIQAFWVFEKPINASSANVKHCEALSRGLSVQYNTDKVQNIDRIMRIPFTQNVPTPKKLKLGRKQSLATITHASSKHGTRYSKINFITPAHAEENTASISDYDISKLSDKLPDELGDKLRSSANDKIINLWTGKVEKPSRSEGDFTLTKELKHAGFNLDEIAQILWCFPFGKNKELSGREISRCYARVEDKPFEGLPKEYIDKINNQTNPIIEEQNKSIIIEGEQPKRLKAIEAATADWQSSGKPMIKKMIDQNTIIVMYGQSNTGKSFAATDMAGHIASGQNWGQFKVPEQLGVLYICAEAGMSYSKRVTALKHRLGLNNTTLQQFPYEYVAMGVNFLNEKQDIKDVVLLAKAQEQKTNIKVGLIVVDTLATTFSGGNENSSDDMGKFIENMKWIQEHAQTAVMIVHHSGKDQAAGARGHSSLRAATDTEFEITSEKQGELYKRQLKTKKQRDGDSDLSVPFALQIHQLGLDEDNEPIDTCHLILENDDQFDMLTPSKFDGMSHTHKSLYDAIEIYKAMPNPDMYQFTPLQKVVLLFNDILKGVGVLVQNDRKVDVSYWGVLEAPNNSQLKTFGNNRKAMIEAGFLNEIELKQLLRG